MIRVWQLPVDQLLAGGVGTLPLAPVSDVDEARVPDVIRRMKERLSRERRRQLADDLWAATYVLLGLRYSKAFAHLLFQGVLGMEESVTYQGIVGKGRLDEARRLLFLLGEERLAPNGNTGVSCELRHATQARRASEGVLSNPRWRVGLVSPPNRYGKCPAHRLVLVTTGPPRSGPCPVIASRESMRETGRPITGDQAIAMKQGPVLGGVYDLIRGTGYHVPTWAKHFQVTQYHVKLTEDPTF